MLGDSFHPEVHVMHVMSAMEVTAYWLHFASEATAVQDLLAVWVSKYVRQQLCVLLRTVMRPQLLVRLGTGSHLLPASQVPQSRPALKWHALPQLYARLDMAEQNSTRRSQLSRQDKAVEANAPSATIPQQARG